jgi:hypothetical protein
MAEARALAGGKDDRLQFATRPAFQMRRRLGISLNATFMRAAA